MSSKKPLPEGLMAQLHGKGSMSEVLRIERQRLMEQANEEMRLQLGSQLSGPGGGASFAAAPAASFPAAGAAPAALPKAAPALEVVPQPDTYQPSKLPMSALPAKPVMAPKQALSAMPQALSAMPQALSAMPQALSANAPANPQASAVRRSQEGLSKLSRFVGDDLSEFDGIITHSEQTIPAAPEWPTDPYYVDVNNSLPFSSQRDLLAAICRLTVGWGSFSCRITLSLLSAASGIRNAKTLRKWLADLQRKRHIRYVPVHGDLRGSIIELTPPEEVRSSIERGWRTNRMKF